MAVTIHIHRTHRRHTGGRKTVVVEGATVGACLENLLAQYPDLREHLFERQGKLRRYLEVYHNLQSAYPEEMARSTGDGDEIHITMMLAGG